MKKNYIFTLLLTFCFTALSFGQTPIITMIADGDCSGGTPKVLEVYANGTVDFTLFSLENQTNANTTWGNSQNLADFGTVTDDFVYLVNKSDLTIFNAEFPSLSNAKIISTGALSVNGDDRLRIVKDSDSSIIDQYGVEGTDGDGTSWEYKDGFAKRNNATVGNTGSFNDANWTFSNGGLNGLGTCQGGATFGSIIAVGTYTPATASLKNYAIEGFATYPNPITNKEFTISSSSASVKEIAIFNVIGKKVLATRFSGTEAIINVSAISEGIYILKVTEAGKTASKKLVIR
jgi:hypothetical protein